MAAAAPVTEVPELAEAEVIRWRTSGAPVIDLLTRARRLGPVAAVRLGEQRWVLVTGARAVHHVLAARPERYIKRSHRLRRLLGNGVITAEGDLWRGQRRLLQSQFTVQGVRRYEQLMHQAAQDIAHAWTDVARSGRPRDLTADMRRFSLDVIWRAITGQALDHTSHRQCLAAGRIVAATAALGPTAETACPDLGDDFADVETVAERAIAAARTNTAPGLLDGLLNAGPCDQTRQLIRDNIVTLLVAGYETTAATLTWLLLHLHDNPGRRDWALDRGPAGSPRRTEAIRALISETLRLYPTAWLLLRHATRDDTLAGHRIEAGTILALCPYLTHRDPDLWPDPCLFRPQRFIDPPRRPVPGAYYPFGLGPRACLGAHFSLTEMTILAETLLPAFDFTLNQATPRPTFGMTIHPDRPLLADVIERRLRP
ncbi:cytochrome P450 [Nonomuraea sp. NPDC050404]|uniref:cytochrome P450 n=1 Tax=Nonomuraea sp. NPDC050404 TaxID=3155783 RepID=UPI0033E044CE